MQETAIHEAVLQVGNKDDNGVTDTDFDMEQWKVLKKSGHEKEASEYALAHLNKSENTERTKRILHRAVDRIANLDPEHLVVIRADYHGDEPCGTGHGHIAYVLRATGYEKGMDARVGSVTALKQMGFEKTPDKEYGITQLHERFKEIIAEEMVADALEYGYEAIQRAPDSGEHRKHSTVGEFRLLAAERQDAEEVKKANEKQRLANEEDARKNREDTDSIVDSVIAQQIESFALERKEKSLDAQQKNIKLVREDTVKLLQTSLDAEDENDLYTLLTLFKQKVKDVEDDKEKIKTDKENLATEKEELKKSQDEMDLRLENISLRETALDDVKLDLDERKKKQEEDEAAFQVKEDALEAQKLVNETKETKLNQRDAELDKKANAIDTLIADAESYKSPVDIAKHVLNILKESMTAEGQRFANKFIGILDRNFDSLNQKYQMQVDEIRTKREQIKQGVYFDTDEQQDEFDRSK